MGFPGSRCMVPVESLTEAIEVCRAFFKSRHGTTYYSTHGRANNRKSTLSNAAMKAMAAPAIAVYLNLAASNLNLPHICSYSNHRRYLRRFTAHRTRHGGEHYAPPIQSTTLPSASTLIVACPPGMAGIRVIQTSHRPFRNSTRSTTHSRHPCRRASSSAALTAIASGPE